MTTTGGNYPHGCMGVKGNLFVISENTGPS